MNIMTLIADFPIQANVFSSNNCPGADEALAKNHPEKWILIGFENLFNFENY